MPDFERTLDQLRLDLARTPEQKARAEGFIAGKSYARKEVAILVFGLVGLGFFLWGWIAV